MQTRVAVFRSESFLVALTVPRQCCVRPVWVLDRWFLDLELVRDGWHDHGVYGDTASVRGLFAETERFAFIGWHSSLETAQEAYDLPLVHLTLDDAGPS